jgi:hypothetical protein
MSLAESLGFSGENLHQMGVASLLHDVGKIFIPEEILNKPGKLSQDERAIIETHTVKGARYLLGLEGIPKLAVISAFEHHLKYDGSGYPSIKGGWTPNIASQIICRRLRRHAQQTVLSGSNASCQDRGSSEERQRHIVQSAAGRSLYETNQAVIFRACDEASGGGCTE